MTSQTLTRVLNFSLSPSPGAPSWPAQTDCSSTLGQAGVVQRHWGRDEPGLQEERRQWPLESGQGTCVLFPVMMGICWSVLSRTDMDPCAGTSCLLNMGLWAGIGSVLALKLVACRQLGCWGGRGAAPSDPLDLGSPWVSCVLFA